MAKASYPASRRTKTETFVVNEERPMDEPLPRTEPDLTPRNDSVFMDRTDP
jgi:hypothetical protein